MDIGSDLLTGLLGRRAFEVEVARRSTEDWRSLALLDLDGFKLVNDQHGHWRGDQTLRAFADLVRSGTPDTSLVARVGGDEIAVLTQVPAPGLARLLDLVNLRLVERDDLALTFSAGVVSLGSGDSVEERMRDADAAMFHAKHQGRGLVVVHGRTTEEFAADRRDLFDRMTRMHAENVRLRAESLTDALTGIGNRRALDRRLAAVDADPAEASGWAVLFVDLDQFSDFNHRNGDTEGDQVLRAVAQTLASELRAQDSFRKGGEEFVVLAPVPSSPAAWALGERLRSAVEQLGIAHGGPGRPLVTVSVGVAMCDEVGSVSEAMVLAAERAFWLKTNDRRNAVLAEDPLNP
jgi:diguanylate cyclase (GGDEF)-like protein